MSDSDPYWAHMDYSLYIYREKTLFQRKPRELSPHLWDLPACLAPAWHLRVTYGTLHPYFLTTLGTTAAVTSLQTR